VNAAGAGLFGLVLGGVIMTVLTLLPFGHSKAAH
jgi:hypothetical protein